MSDNFQDNRKKTDKSLKSERNKTDNFLDNESQSIEDQSDESLISNRKSADKKLKFQRAQVDLDKSDDLVPTPLLDAERLRSDSAQQIARDVEDRLRNSERFQKRLIAEALLENERKDTDSNLLNERNKADNVSKQESLLVTNAETALVTRDQYLAIVSHDLKNPLSSISLSASSLKRTVLSGKLDQGNIVKSLETIERSVANMDRLISDLLDVEQMSSGAILINPKLCDINIILKECIEIFAPAVMNKSFVMNIIPNSGPLFAKIDHDRIVQVLSNLIGNALKFTPTSGLIELSAKKEKDQIIVTVKDNGPGIPEDKRVQIFERFSQLKLNDRRGLGLGLFISKWIVEAHGGQIHVTSNGDQGSKFYFTIPSVT